MRHRLLRKEELLSLFAVAAAFLCLVSSVGAEKAETLNANHRRCVSGKMDGIKRQEGGGGEQDVTVDGGGQTMAKLEGTPKDTFRRAMVRDANQLDYELVADYDGWQVDECKKAIEGLVEAEGCRLVEDWQRGGKCAGGKCTGGRLHVRCGLSKEQTVQQDGSVQTEKTRRSRRPPMDMRRWGPRCRDRKGGGGEER